MNSFDSKKYKSSLQEFYSQMRTNYI